MSTADYDFTKAFERIKETCQSSTQFDLACVLGIAQSSVASACKRGVIPAPWLLKVLRKTATNPDWILYGDKHPQKLVASNERLPSMAETLSRLTNS